jgi:hypothetical protein
VREDERGPQALLRSANRAIGLATACGHGRTAGSALPAHTLERAMIYRVALADGIMDRVTYQDPPEDAS